MPSAVIDACCLIDLLASGYVEAILRRAGFKWHVPTAVELEVKYVRQRDPEAPERTIAIPADLVPLVSREALCICKPDSNQELDNFTRYAAVFRSDGEAMCLAIAETRGWIVATDDRKAIRLAQEAGIGVVSCPQLIKTWADSSRPTDAVLQSVLKDIQFLAQFSPNSAMPCCQWWVDRLGKAGR